MENPFVYGEAVGGEFFTNREREIATLKSELRSGQNIIIFSPRRYGKTSLIKKVLSELKREDFIGVYIDLFFVTSKQKFIETYATALASSLRGTREKIISKLKELIPKLIPKIVIKTRGMVFEFEFDKTKRNIAPILEDLYESAHRTALKQKKKAIVVFDEFQELLNFDDGEIEKGMRSHFQFHRNVAYVFLGSKRNLMHKLFDDKSRPFYGSGRKFPLGKISVEDFHKFIKKKFLQTGFRIDDAIISQILEITQCHPYYTQELCHYLWERALTSKQIKEKDIEEAISEIIFTEGVNYSLIWEDLTAKQRNFLIALAQNPGINIYSTDFIISNLLGTPSSVQRIAKLLYNKQIIDKENGKASFEDLFFERWVRSKS